MIFYYNSTQLGAPVLSGTAGALRTVLKTCLVDGFGAGSASGISVAGGVATVTFSGAHPYIVDSTVQIAGATPAALNGEKRVAAVGASSITFAAPGVPDGAATGTITAKVPGAGWQEMFAGTANLLVLKPTAVEATGMLLRVDDTGTTNARVRAYESMSDANTGVGPSPADSQVSGGGYLSKSDSASTAVRAWFLFADARGFHMFVDVSGSGRFSSWWAGDINSLKSGDAWCYLLTCNTFDQTGTSNAPDSCNSYSNRGAREGAYLQRAHTGLGSATAAQRVGVGHSGTAAAISSGAAGYIAGSIPFPNPPNNGLLVCAVEVIAGQGVRGTLPMIYHIRGDTAGALRTGDVIDGTNDLAGRRLLVIYAAPPVAGAQFGGPVLVDLSAAR